MVVICKIIEWIKLRKIAVCKNQCFMSWDGFIPWNLKEVGLKPLIHKKFYSVLLFTTLYKWKYGLNSKGDVDFIK